MGIGKTHGSETPVEITYIPEKIASVAAGTHFSFAITEGGNVYGTGENYSQQVCCHCHLALLEITAFLKTIVGNEWHV